MGLFSSPRRKNTKGNRLRRMMSKIKKLEKKAAMEKALKAAQTKLNSLRKY